MTRIQRVLTLTMITGTFLLDSLTPLGYATWLLYLVPVLYLSRNAREPEVVLHLFLISVFMVINFFLSPPGGVRPSLSLTNRTLWIAGLWTLALLYVRRHEAEENLSAINQRLRESEANLRTLFDSSHDAIFVHDLDGRVIDVNTRVLEMYGINHEQALSLSVPELSSPDNPLDLLPEIWKDVAAGKSRYIEWKARRAKDHSVFDVEVFLTKIRLREQDAILATVHDVTGRKQAEEELKLTRFSVDHASVCAYLVDCGARILYVNEQTCRTLGYTREELLSMTVHDLDPDYPQAVWDEHWAHLKQEGSLHFETTQRKKDGTLVPLDLSLNFFAFGGREYNVAFALDISERKKAEQELTAMSRQYELILDSAGDGIFGMNRSGEHILVNKAALRMLGYEAADLMGRRSHSIWHHTRADGRPYPEDECRIHGTMIGGPLHVEDEVFWKKDGSSIPVAYTTTPIREGTEIVGTVVTFRDIAERKQAEQALRESEEELHKAYAGLEQEVRERTRALAAANHELRLEVRERQRAEERLRKAKDLSDGLNRLAALIHSTLDLDEIMQRMLEESARTMDADAAMIGWFEEDAFRMGYTHNLPAAFTSRRLKASELRAVHHVALARDALAFNDASTDERLNLDFVREAGIRSLLVAPLFIKHEVAGTLSFYGLSRRIHFGEERVDFARKLAASISLALENARLYQALVKSEKLSSSRFAQLTTIYDTAPVGLCFLDRNFRYVRLNQRLAEINGIPVEESIGRAVREVLPRIADQVETSCRQALETGRPVTSEITSRSQTDQDVTVSSSYYPVRNEGDEILGFNIVVQDITERKRMEEALQGSERLLKAIVNSIPDMAWLKDREGRFILVNEAFGAAAGKPPGELVGKTDLDAWPEEIAEKYRADDQEVIRRRERKRVEEPLAGPGGSIAWIDTIKTPIHDQKGEVIGTVGIARDITKRKRMEEEIRHMALHDVLTGLPNRRLLLDIMPIGMAEARRHESKLAILFADLDRFKEVNDTLGHEAGDQLLKAVAKRLKASVRESDTVARIGGDEFNILLTDIARPEDAISTIRKIVDCFQTPFLVAGHELHVTTSLGISIYPDDSREIETLFRYADIALYHAKESGRNTYRFYNPAINIRSIERMRMGGFLRQALNRGELVVHYQSQVEIKTGKIVCAEALVRWNHPEQGLLESKQFIHLAEETGFITAIDEWVLETICSQYKQWLDAGLAPPCLTMNLSAREFQNQELVATIARVLAETGMPAECLDIEITEGTAMHDIAHAISRLDQLAAMGVRISIDDFGIGYSSLNYLKKMPIQKLKIDQSFVKDLTSDPDDQAIIRAVTAMAHNMKMRVLAEGVETEEQLAFLEEINCDEAQGYLFSKPLPAAQFEELIAEGVR